MDTKNQLSNKFFMTEEFLFKIHNHVEIYICIKMSKKSFFMMLTQLNNIQSIQKKFINCVHS